MYTLYKFHFLNGISEINQLFYDILIIWTAPVYTYTLRGHWILESDWLTNVLRCAAIFRETYGKRSSRQHAWPHYSSISLRQMISVISKVLHNNQNDTGQTNKYSKQTDKIDRYCLCFCHKIILYYVRKHSLTLFSLSRSRSLPHRRT